MCMQLFNQINARMINDELNVFRGILRAPLFLWILLLEAALQVCLPVHTSQPWLPSMHIFVP